MKVWIEYDFDPKTYMDGYGVLEDDFEIDGVLEYSIAESLRMTDGITNVTTYRDPSVFVVRRVANEWEIDEIVSITRERPSLVGPTGWEHLPVIEDWHDHIDTEHADVIEQRGNDDEWVWIERHNLS